MKSEFFKAAEAMKQFKPSDGVRVKEYRLMYLFGAWVTSDVLHAESDAEAIHDADELPRVASDKLQYVLFCGNRRVKTYPAPTGPRACRVETIKLNNH